MYCKKCNVLIMQDLQIVNNAANATYQQLTRQHSITLPLYQFDLVYRPSTDRIGGPAIRSPGRPVPVTAPGGQTGRPCRTMCQSAIRPDIRHSPYRAPLVALMCGSQRPQSRPGITQSHLKPCPPLTFWAFRPLRPESASF